MPSILALPILALPILVLPILALATLPGAALASGADSERSTERPGTSVVIDAAARARGATIDIRSAALLVSDQAGGSLPVAVAVFRGPADQLFVRTEVDGAAVLDALAESGSESDGEAGDGALSGEVSGEVTVHVYALGSNLEVLDAASLAIDIDPDLARRSRDGGLRIGTRLRVPWGDSDRPDTLSSVAVRTLVWAGEELALHHTEVSRADGPVLFEPRFEDPGPWIRVEPPGAPLGPRAGAAILPASARSGNAAEAAEEIEPADDFEGASARPLLIPARPLTVRFAASGPAPRQVGWVIEGRDGQELRVPIEDLRPIPGRGKGVRGMAGILTLPAELPEGVYRATLEADTHAPSLGFEIAVVSAQRPRVAWPRLAGLSTLAPTRSSVEGDGVLLPEEAEARVARLRLDYLAALAGLDAEDSAQSERSAIETLARRLVRVETEAVRELGSQGMSILHQVQHELMASLERRLRRLAAREGGRAQARAKVGGAFLGWATAHLHMAPIYAEGREFRLSRHALDVVVDTVERRVPSSSAFDAMAARCLSLVAHRSQTRGQLDSAEALFARALERSGDEPSVLYGHALGQERLGQLEAAIEAFESVVEAWPEHREARLRLASVSHRAGLLDRAREHLGVLLSEKAASAVGDGESWLILLAHQERARLELASVGPSIIGRSVRAGQALERIEASLGVYPDDPGLLVARARALDLAGRLDEARSALLRLDRPAKSLSETVRSRYNGWPEAEFEKLLLQVDREAEPYLDLLRRAAASLHQAETR